MEEVGVLPGEWLDRIHVRIAPLRWPWRSTARKERVVIIFQEKKI